MTAKQGGFGDLIIAKYAGHTLVGVNNIPLTKEESKPLMGAVRRGKIKYKLRSLIPA